MRKYLSLIPLVLITTSTAVAQGLHLRGRLHFASDSTNIVGASIKVRDDKSQDLAMAVSDSLGRFDLKVEAAKSSELIISFLGLRSYSTALQGKSGVLDLGSIYMAEDESLLSEVTVTAHRKGQQIDRRVFNFSERLTKASRSGKDLMRFIPDLHLDLLTERLSSVSSGGSVVLLINGVESTMSQLKSIPPELVKEVVYYDIPPARYAGAGAVVDVIVPKHYQGISLGADLMAAVTTGFANGSAYLQFVRGKHQYGIDYSLNYRNYDERVGETNYAYAIAGEQRRLKQKQQDEFGYTTHVPTLRYSYKGTNDEVLQASLSVGHETRHNDGFSMNTYERGSLVQTNRAGKSSYSQYWSPTLDLYYSRHLGKKHELSANVVTATYFTKAEDHTDERDALGVPTLTDDMFLQNKSLSLTGELAHTYSAAFGKLSTGYRLTTTTVDYDVDNMYGKQEYTTSSTQHYAYTQLRGNIKKLFYSASLGFTHLNSRQSGFNYVRNVLTPSLLLSSAVGKGQSLRLYMSYSPNVAPASFVSNNRRSIAQGLSYVGNPQLLGSEWYMTNLRYTYGNKWLNLAASLQASYNKGYIYEVYNLSQDGLSYEESYANAHSLRILSGSLQVELKPFGDALSLRLFAEPKGGLLRTQEGNYRYFSVRNQAILTFVHRSLTLQYGVSIPEWSLSYGGLSKTRETHGVYAQYQTGNWAFGCSISTLFAPTSYWSKTNSLSAVEYSSRTDIYDNKNMLLLAVSYSFSSGKQQRVNRNLSNSTEGAVLF